MLKSLIKILKLTYGRTIIRADLPIADAAGERPDDGGVCVDGHGAVGAGLVVRTHGAHDHEQKR